MDKIPIKAGLMLRLRPGAGGRLRRRPVATASGEGQQQRHRGAAPDRLTDQELQELTTRREAHAPKRRKER